MSTHLPGPDQADAFLIDALSEPYAAALSAALRAARTVTGASTAALVAVCPPGDPPGTAPTSLTAHVPSRTTHQHGYLRVTQPHSPSASFDKSRRESLVALAVLAGAALDAALLHETYQRRAEWAAAAAEAQHRFTRRLGDDHEVWTGLVDLIGAFTQADYAAAVVPDPRNPGLTHFYFDDGNVTLAWTPCGAAEDLHLRAGKPLVLDLADSAAMRAVLPPPVSDGSVLVLPVGDALRYRGALVLARAARRSVFSVDQVDAGVEFAALVSLGWAAAARRTTSTDDSSRRVVDSLVTVAAHIAAASRALSAAASDSDSGAATGSDHPQAVAVNVTAGMALTAAREVDLAATRLELLIAVLGDR